MTDFKKICLELSKSLSNIEYDNGDITDIGNEIGYILGKYISEDSWGWKKNDLLLGIDHGISLANGTH